MIDAVLDYYKVPVTIHSYTKDQSDAKSTGTPSKPKFTGCVVATSSNSEEVAGLNTNDDGNFMLDGKNYPLKAFVPEEIYFGKLSRVLGGACREKKMGLSLKPDKNNNKWGENINDRRTLKASTTKAGTKS